MKLSPRAPAEGINTPQERRSKTIVGLLAGAIVVVGLFFYIVTGVVDMVVEHLDPETEKSLFEAHVPDMLEAFADGGFDEAAEAAIAPLFERVVAAGPTLPYDFTLRVSCQRAPNAMALPGGAIVVTAGLLDVLETEEELAFVLGHELGHFVHRDHLRGMGRGLALQLVMGMMFLTTGMDPTVALQVAIEALSSAHSRGQEVLADGVGLDVLGVISPQDVSGAERALHALTTALGEGGLDQVDFLRSHPVGAVRLEALNASIIDKALRSTRMEGTPLPAALKGACQEAQPQDPESTP